MENFSQDYAGDWKTLQTLPTKLPTHRPKNGCFAQLFIAQEMWPLRIGSTAGKAGRKFHKTSSKLRGPYSYFYSYF